MNDQAEGSSESSRDRILSIGGKAAAKRMQRQKWRRAAGNDMVRVVVPPEWLRHVRRRQQASDLAQDPSAAFEAAATAWRDRAASAETRASRAEAENDHLIADLRAERERSAAEMAREWEERERIRAALDRAEQGRKAAEARADAATTRADHDDEALASQRARADQLQERIGELLAQIAASDAEAKAANDRAWASGEAAGALREQLAAMERRLDAERKRAERAEKRADNDRDALLNSESKTWRTLASLEAADTKVKQLQSRLAEAEAASATALRSADVVPPEHEERSAQGLFARLWAAWRAG